MAALKNIWEKLISSRGLQQHIFINCSMKVSYYLMLPITMAPEDHLKGTKAIDLKSNLVLV